MKKRIVVYRNKYLDARRYYVSEMATAKGLKPPFDSLDLKDTKTKNELTEIANHFSVSVPSIVSSLQKAKYAPSKKDDIQEKDACWISESEACTSNLREIRMKKAEEFLRAGWPVNAVNEYLGLSFYTLYPISRKITKSGDISIYNLEGRREGEVFKLWAKGLSQTDIANSLNITRQTVNSDLKKYKDAYISEHREEDWKILEDEHNTNCTDEKKEKKHNYSSKAEDAKKIVQKYINTDNGSLTMSIAGIEAVAKVNSKTVQKFVLLTLMEKNLSEKAVEFAIGIVGQPEIIRPALNLCASKNESFNAVKFVLVEREELKNDKKYTDIKTLVIDVIKQIKLKTEIKNKINKDGSLKVSIAEMEKEFKLNTKTVQKFVLLTLMEKNLTERAVEFAVGIIGQPEIIKLALNHFASENEEYEENENYKAVNYVFDKRVDLKKEKKQLNDTKALVDKVLERIKQGHLEKMYIKQKRKRAYRWLLN